MPKRKKHVKQAQAGGTQPSIASNTPANPIQANVPQPTELLTNQNLQNSPASAAALPHLHLRMLIYIHLILKLWILLTQCRRRHHSLLLYK